MARGSDPGGGSRARAPWLCGGSCVAGAGPFDSCTVTGSGGPFASFGRRPRVAAASRERGTLRRGLFVAEPGRPFEVRPVEVERHLLAGSRKAVRERGLRGPGLGGLEPELISWRVRGEITGETQAFENE